MDRRHFVRLGLASSAAGLLLPAAAARAEGDVLATPFAGGIYYTRANPGRWAEKAAGHSPVVETSGKMVLVTTPHEMKAHEHYIVKHLLLDANMKVLGEKMFDPTKDSAAVSEYELAGFSGAAYALSMCNKHDVWVTAFNVG